MNINQARRTTKTRCAEYGLLKRMLVAGHLRARDLRRYTLSSPAVSILISKNFTCESGQHNNWTYQSAITRATSALDVQVVSQLNKR